MAEVGRVSYAIGHTADIFLITKQRKNIVAITEHDGQQRVEGLQSAPTKTLTWFGGQIYHSRNWDLLDGRSVSAKVSRSGFRTIHLPPSPNPCDYEISTAPASGKMLISQRNNALASARRRICDLSQKIITNPNRPAVCPGAPLLAAPHRVFPCHIPPVPEVTRGHERWHKLCSVRRYVQNV
ncbi:hypothetical protein Syun_004209 [Stephania yunnanensis]|uniref:Uncharacterized protein n=1 Tax=Stephania yunnanensis TaxID=152371 RepID=A0AAP0L446_9MAGN